MHYAKLYAALIGVVLIVVPKDIWNWAKTVMKILKK